VERRCGFTGTDLGDMTVLLVDGLLVILSIHRGYDSHVRAGLEVSQVRARRAVLLLSTASGSLSGGSR
jgi:hypothetical protein